MVSISYHQPKPDPESILLRNKWIYLYYRNGYSPKEIQQIFYNSSENKIKEIIQEMEKYPVAQMVGELYDKGYKVRSIRKRLKLTKQEFDELLDYYQKNIKRVDLI